MLHWLVVVVWEVGVGLVVGVVGRLVWNVDRVRNLNFNMLLTDVLDLLMALLLILNVFHRFVLCLTSEDLFDFFLSGDMGHNN